MDYNILANLEYCKEIVDWFRNLLLYSHIPTVIIALAIGFFAYKKSRDLLLSKILILITIFFGFWAFLDIVIWLGYAKASLVMFAWMPIELFSIPLFILSFYFTYVFIYKKDLPRWGKILIALPIVPIIIAAPTKLNLVWFDIQECIAVESGLYSSYVLYVKLFFSVITAGLILLSLFLKKGWEAKRRILILAIGVLMFLYSFLISGYVSEITLDYTQEMYGLFGMIVFVGALYYLIVRFSEFNIKILGTQALVWGLWALIGSEFFFATTTTNKILILITLAISIVFGISLIRSVKREVKQRERLEEVTKALGQANTKLKKADEMKDQFLSFASHDLKSPVAKMKQWASLIYDKTYKEPKQIEDTAYKIKITGDRALRLVEEFLDLRKIEEGKMDFNPEVKNVVALVKDISNDFSPVAQQKGLELSFSSKKEDLQGNVDEIKFRQVIENLIDNSIKYTDEGSIRVEVSEEQHSILIAISDTGGGMSKEVISGIFEQFHRAEGVKKTIKGTGLGLYIAKQIVESHHGQIWAESEGEGKGSTFKVRIPKK